jgi:hypothetical protein
MKTLSIRRVLVSLGTVVMLAGLPALGAPPTPTHLGSLALDGTLFWHGGYVGEAVHHSLPLAPSNAAIDRCAQVDPCFAWTLDIAPGGASLRVGLDTPARDDGFEMTITPPSGPVVRRTNSNAYSMEAFVTPPLPGRYTITVAPYSAELASFRMRAKLESAPYVPPVTGDLLPNLVVTRMWEFGFAAPANPGNGLFPPDDINPPLDAAGKRPVSCAADEMVEEGAVRCLRYSFGLGNAGHGNFDIRYSQNVAGTVVPMTQCVQRSSGAPTARPAGTGVYHQTHGHWHYNNIIFHRLFRVTDSVAGVMVPVGDGKKLGYSPADQGIVEWGEFTQGLAGSSGGAGNCAPGTGNRLGMSRGWGDAYRYQRPGNYVEFGTNADGRFVVQTIADPEDVVLETDETDNTTYAYIEITGDAVDVIETGRGSSPWDPTKVVLS